MKGVRHIYILSYLGFSLAKAEKIQKNLLTVGGKKFVGFQFIMASSPFAPKIIAHNGHVYKIRKRLFHRKILSRLLLFLTYFTTLNCRFPYLFISINCSNLGLSLPAATIAFFFSKVF